MKKIISIVILVFVAYKINPNNIFGSWSNKGAFDSQGNPQVVVFTAPGCPPCDGAVALLKKRKIEFERVDVTTDKEGENRLRGYGSSNSLPAIIIGNEIINGFNRLGLVSALSEKFGSDVLSRNERRVMKTHFDTNGKPILVMYGTSWCPYCKKARTHFAAHGVHYKEVDVEQSENGKLHFNILEGRGYPLIYIGFRRIDHFDLDKIGKLAKALVI